MIGKLKIRNLIYRIAPYAADWHQAWQLAKSYRHWRTNGLPIPAPHPVKRALLLREALRIKAETFVETGTFTGDTVWFMRDRFPKVFSIEVQPQLAALATKLFSNNSSVEIVEGDSATVLTGIARRIHGSAIFWLDGHYSAGITGRGAKDCPIFEELQAIANHPPARFSIVIDDRRCFGTDPAYPPYTDLLLYIGSLFPKLDVTDEMDMIWCRSK